MVVAGKNIRLDEATFKRMLKVWLEEPDLSAATIGKRFGLAGDTVSRYMSEYPRERLNMTPKRKSLRDIYGDVRRAG